MDNNTFDVIIVGGGPAGLVLATRLSEDPTLQVLVLEVGPDLSEIPEELRQAVMTPAANTQLIGTPVDWKFKSTQQPNMAGRELIAPQGKMLGGSTGMNGLLFVPSSKAVIDGWAELGNPGWEWSDFSKSQAQTYTAVKAGEKSSGTEGPLQVTYAADYTDGWTKIWADTIESLGFPGAQDLLSPYSCGGLMIPETIDPATGTRSYSGNAYLTPEVRGRANLKIRTGVEVKKVLLGKSGNMEVEGEVIATGVDLTDLATGASTQVLARREVILSAGAFGSPKILELSGIGDAKRLGEGQVVVDSPGVGENLQNHIMTTVSFQLTEDAPTSMDPFARGALRQDPEVLAGPMQEYMEHHTGPLASSNVVSAALLPLPLQKTPEGVKELRNSLDRTGFQSSGAFAAAHERFVSSILSSPSEPSGYYIFAPAYAAFNPDGTSAPPPMDGSEDNYVSVALILAHPLSRGSVHVVGAGADQKLAIDPAFLSNPLDVEVMARHVQFIEKDLATVEPLAKWVKPDGKRAIGAPEAGELKNIDVARKFIQSHSFPAHHYTGSCSMLPREMGGVVNPSLRVYGTKNLRVCDASVIPLVPSANPQATIYGMAEHAARLIKDSLYSS